MAEVEKKVLLKESIAPSISAEHKEMPKEEPEVLIAKPVAKSKKSPLRKLAETFIKEDLKNVGTYVVQDVLIPAVGDTICTMVQESVERIFHGDGGYSYSDRGKSKVPYNSISSGRRRYSSGPVRESITLENRDRFDDPIFTYRDDALKVRDEMWERIGAYGQVTIARVKSMIGDESRSYVDNNWGWIEDQVDNIEIRKVREGYRLFLPRPVYLKD